MGYVKCASNKNMDTFQLLLAKCLIWLRFIITNHLCWRWAFKYSGMRKVYKGVCGGRAAATAVGLKL